MHIGYMTVMSFIDRWYSETCHQCTRRNNVHTDPCWSSYTVSSSCSMASCHAGVGSSSGCTTLHSGLPHSQERDSVSIRQKSIKVLDVQVESCLQFCIYGLDEHKNGHRHDDQLAWLVLYDFCLNHTLDDSSLLMYIHTLDQQISLWSSVGPSVE